jgi:hypothetical protein
MSKLDLAVDSLEDLEAPFEIGSWLVGVAVGIGIGVILT